MDVRKAKIEEEQAPVADTGQEAVDKDLADLYNQVQKASDERDALKDQLLRTMADFQNFRKRQEDQRRLLEQFATERFVTSLLPVLDNFERTLTAIEAGVPVEAIGEGVRAVERQLRSVLEGQNVTRILSVGEHFDANVHEAIAIEPTEEHPEDTVIQEVEAGYRMGEKVIRPARVRVAKRP